MSRLRGKSSVGFLLLMTALAPGAAAGQGATGPAGATPFNSGPPGAFPAPRGAASAAVPRRLPDWSGVWGRIEGIEHPDPTRILPFMKPDAAAAFKKQIADKSFYVPWSHCDPAAFPVMMTDVPFGLSWDMAPDHVQMVMADGERRVIYTDGRPAGQPAAGGLYFGNSTGRWEGDTLVVETTDLRSDNEVVIGLRGGNEKLKVVERIRLLAPDRLEDRITITGPDFLSKPFTETQVFKRYPNTRLGEFLCVASQNQDSGDKLILTPPPEALQGN